MSDVHPGFEKLTRERKQDARGSLFEFLRNVPGGAQIYVFTIEPGQIRGNHWHNRKCEWFACVNGSATLVLRADQGRADPVTRRS